MSPRLARREFLAALAGPLAAPLSASGQATGRIPRVGSLHSGTKWATFPLAAPLAALGHVEGETIVFELRYADGHEDRLPALAAGLVRLHPEVIVAWGLEPLDAVRKATSRIPIVMVAGGDPVATGLVGSLSRPGGQITGVTVGGPEIAGKQLELLREVLPGLSRVAVLWHPATEPAILDHARAAARALNVQSLVFTVRGPADFEGAFRAAVKARAKAVQVHETSMLTANQAKLAELAIRHRLPAVASRKSTAQAGFLMSYGPDFADLHPRTASYIDRILRGARPGDLPIERPTTFELVLNLKTARALGLAIPPALLQRANLVVE